MKKNELLEKLKLLRREETEEKDKASVAESIDVLIQCCEFILNNNQPERSKREDSFDVRCMESESKGYFVTAQIAGTSDWIEMRCSELMTKA